MHIADYDRPLDVAWYCRDCRLLVRNGPDRKTPDTADRIAGLLRTFDARRRMLKGPVKVRGPVKINKPRRVA
jgi:hypothetical protein